MPLHINNVSTKALMVNGVEKYRLVIGGNQDQSQTATSDSLKYAKGWINFDLNLIRDGSGKWIDYKYTYTNNRKGIYAYYDEGFYRRTDGSWFYEGKDDLLKINNLSSAAAIFEGWYTSPVKDNGKKITSIKDVFRHTNLFDYKHDGSLPQITLYACWKIRTYTVTIKSPPNGQFSMWYDGRRTSYARMSNIPYNTEIISYINSKVSNLKFIVSHASILDGTQFQQDLREGRAPYFLGWATSGRVSSKKSMIGSRYIKNDIELYPQFFPILLWPRRDFDYQWQEGNTTYHEWGHTGYGYYCDLPSISYNRAKSKIKEAKGNNRLGWELHSTDGWPLWTNEVGYARFTR